MEVLTMANEDPRMSVIRACKAVGGTPSKDGSECFMRGDICAANVGTKVDKGCILSMDKLKQLISNG